MSDAGNNGSSGIDNGQPDAVPQIVSPGAQLAAYRKDRGWTVEQVASQLNLAPRQIAAIESDDYPALPGMVIVRGFIRAYAKLLKVDSTPLLAALGGETVMAGNTITPRAGLATPFSEARLPTMMDRPGLSSKWMFGVLLLLLLGVAIWAAQQTDEFSGLSQSASSQVKGGLAYLSGSQPTAQKPEAVKPEEQTAAAPAADKEAAAPLDASPAAPATSPVEQQPAGESAATPPAEEAAPTAKDELVLKVREDSWVELRRAGNNGIVVSRVMKGGTTERFDVNEPMSLVVGNAAGVEASLRGAPLQLKANGNVARLNLK